MVRAVFGVLFALTMGSHAAEIQFPCNTRLSNIELSRVLQYGQRSAHLHNVELAVASQETVARGCYQRFLLRRADGKSRWTLELFLSPDHRFLSTDLMDTSLDPVTAETQKEDAIDKALARARSPQIGDREAPVRLVIFGDFECPYCQQLDKLIRERIIPADSALVRLEAKQFPLPSHSLAEPAAESAICALEQSQAAYWVVHKFLYDHQQKLKDYVGLENADVLSQATALDLKVYRACLVSGRAATKIQEDIDLGTSVGTKATPTIFINGERVEGLPDSVDLRYQIERNAAHRK